MLRLLAIRNLGVVDDLELELRPGLNVLTGETGSGKSIIVDALTLLLGERVDESMLRAGASQARVEGVFSLTPALREAAASLLQELGLDGDEDELVLTREINREGRNTCRVNGHLTPLKGLAALGERLADVHAQGQQVSLLRTAEHVGILDRYAGLTGLQMEVAETVAKLSRLREEAASLRANERDLARRMDLLSYEVREIEAARLRVGEDAELERERTVLGNADRLRTLAEEAYHLLEGGEGRRAAAADLLGRVAKDLQDLAALDPSLAHLCETAEGLSAQAEELARSLRGYSEGIEHDPERLQQVEERLSLIAQLKRKYGDAIEEILAYAERASEELAGLENNEDRKAALEAEEQTMLIQLGGLAGRLSRERRAAAGRLAQAVEVQLSEVAMAGTRVEVEVAQVEAEDGAPVTLPSGEVKRYGFTTFGIDRVQFLIAPNLGEPLRPLARTASGGEASRLMLAFKVALSGDDRIPTLVFDEIDAGIGGRVGTVVGKKLWALARSHQVLCVTHLPQAACFADHHVRVAKSIVDGRTVTRVEALEADGRVEEISQMLGSTGKSARHNAWEMMEQASRWKRGGEDERPSGDAEREQKPQLTFTLAEGMVP
jgi:DNA repair protein RecN (Recombination protein N)